MGAAQFRAKRASVRASCDAVAFHHEAGAAARDVCDHRRAPVQLGDGAEIDREGEHYRLAFAQPEVRRLDEDARGAEIHGLAKLAVPAGNGDVNGRPGSVPSMQAAFHLICLAGSGFCFSRSRLPALCLDGIARARRLNLINP